MISLSRRIGFSAAHKYYQKKFSVEENKKIFGPCYSEHGHGHNYILEMTISGKIDPETGMVLNLVEVDSILKEVVEPLDHHHLNFDVAAFKDIVPTTENVAVYCFEEIQRRLPKDVKLQRVRVFENENLWADYCG
jgi:6-pyruvoyltetrahydropterin/6-carboxytetrahydropterin synthase